MAETRVGKPKHTNGQRWGMSRGERTGRGRHASARNSSAVRKLTSSPFIACRMDLAHLVPDRKQLLQQPTREGEMHSVYSIPSHSASFRTGVEARSRDRECQPGEVEPGNL